MPFDPISEKCMNADAHKHYLKAAQHCAAASISQTEAAQYAQRGDMKSASLHASVAQNHLTQASEHNDMVSRYKEPNTALSSNRSTTLSTTASSVSKTASTTETTSHLNTSSSGTTASSSTTSTTSTTSTKL
jgi:hypothetical protein